MDILNNINWLDFLNEIFSGHNTTLPIVVAVGLIPNFLAWWLTKEKRRKLSVYFRRLNEQELIVAIQNSSDIYIDDSSFVDEIPLLSVTSGTIEEASSLQDSESKLSFTETGIYLHYLNRKSTAIFRIKLGSKGSSISSSQRQKGFRRQVPVIHEQGGNSIGWISLLEIWLQKAFFRTYTIIIPIGMPVILVPLIISGGNWSWYFGLVLFTSMFVLTYLGYNYSKKPRRLWQMYRFYGNDMAREAIGILKERLKKKDS